jgi:hypothetical protein
MECHVPVDEEVAIRRCGDAHAPGRRSRRADGRQAEDAFGDPAPVRDPGPCAPASPEVLDHADRPHHPGQRRGLRVAGQVFDDRIECGQIVDLREDQVPRRRPHGRRHDRALTRHRGEVGRAVGDRRVGCQVRGDPEEDVVRRLTGAQECARVGEEVVDAGRPVEVHASIQPHGSRVVHDIPVSPMAQACCRTSTRPKVAAARWYIQPSPFARLHGRMDPDRWPPASTRTGGGSNDGFDCPWR